MNTVSNYQTQGLAAMRHQVLKNTYWLLALSLVPTVIGAWFGLTSNLSLAGLSPFARIGVFLAGAYGLMYLVEKNKNSSLGVVFLMAFTLFMGFMLTGILSWVLAKSNGADIVIMAAVGTAGIFFVMASLATVIKRDISSMGQWLFAGFLVVFALSIINMVFLSSGIMALALSAVCIFIFSGYMLFTVKSVIDGGETNYISATLTLYISLYNVFTSLLHILGASND